MTSKNGMALQGGSGLEMLGFESKWKGLVEKVKRGMRFGLIADGAFFLFYLLCTIVCYKITAIQK